jgi:hypothetical protein
MTTFFETAVYINVSNAIVNMQGKTLCIMKFPLCNATLPQPELLRESYYDKTKKHSQSILVLAQLAQGC